MRRFLFIVAAAVTTLATAAAAQPQTCPLQGDAKQPLARELNPYKNREDAPPVTKINANATLSAVLAPGNDLQRWSRNDAAVFEGVVVGVKVGGIETVNCHATDPAHRDTHIELALVPGAPETQRVIVEVTPRWRAKMAGVFDWSTAALKKQLLGRRVRITGWLFDDLEHKAEAENTNPGATGDWRATVWEIHPVTGIAALPGVAAAVTVAAPPSARKPTHHRKKTRRLCTRSRGHVCHRASRVRTGTHR